MRHEADEKTVEETEGLILKYLGGDLKRLAEVAGVEAALRISRAFRGTTLYISDTEGLERIRRDENIRNDYHSGLTVRVLAKKYSLSERGVWKVLNRLQARLPARITELLGER